MNNSIIVLSDIIDNRSCLEIFAENKNILGILFEIVANPGCGTVNFNETLNLLILLLKFCVIENYKLPAIYVDKDGIMSNYIDTLVSYDDVTVTHNDLSNLIVETLNRILYHFDLEKDEIKSIPYENTFGMSYKPLGTKR